MKGRRGGPYRLIHPKTQKGDKNDYALVFITSQGLGGASAWILHPKKDVVATFSYNPLEY